MNLSGTHKKNRIVSNFVRLKIDAMIALPFLQSEYVKEIVPMKGLYKIFTIDQFPNVADVKIRGTIQAMRINLPDGNILHEHNFIKSIEQPNSM